MNDSFDLIVLGAGSGGIAAAKRAASYGAKVAIIEGDRVGGTCVIRGCVPKKLLVYGSMYREYLSNASFYGVKIEEISVNPTILLENVRREVDRLNEIHKQLLIKSGVEIVQGWGSFIDSNTIKVKTSADGEGERKLYGNRILISVGSRPKRPKIKGAELGWVSDDIFCLERFPKDIVIVGAGFIACEFASIFNGLGIKVTQIIRSNKLLRGFDSDLSTTLKEEMELKGVDLHFAASPVSIIKKGINLEVNLNTGKSISCTGLLFATGRKALIKRLVLDKAGIQYNQNEIIVDSSNRTNISNVFAIGDVTNRINLTPVAIAQGRLFSDGIFGNKKKASINYDLVPKAVFSQPEIASVGLSEDEAIERFGKEGIEISQTRFRAMSKALPKKGGRCLLKLISNTQSQKVIGCHMIGEHAAEIIQMAAIALEMGATAEDFNRTMALHPTISEEFVTMNS